MKTIPALILASLLLAASASASLGAEKASFQKKIDDLLK